MLGKIKLRCQTAVRKFRIKQNKIKHQVILRSSSGCHTSQVCIRISWVRVAHSDRPCSCCNKYKSKVSNWRKSNKTKLFQFHKFHFIVPHCSIIRFILGNTECSSSYSSLNLSFLCRSSKWKDKRFNAHIVDLHFLRNQAFRHTSNQSMRVKSFLADTVDTKQQLKGAFIHT